MNSADFECPECGDTAVTLYPDGGGDLLAACQGCGREHGRWHYIAAASHPGAARRRAWTDWFKRAPH